MNKNRVAGKRILAAALAVCLCSFSGCSHKSERWQQEKQPVKMTVFVSSKAPNSVREAADEFVNRAAYYSGGELEISINESEQMDSVLLDGNTEFAFVENRDLVGSIEELKTLELPFFFKHADYQFSGMNSARTRKRVNELLRKKYPMKVQMATLCGYEDFAADGSIDLTDFRRQYSLAVKEQFFDDELQQELGSRDIVVEEPMEALLAGETEIASVELSQVVSAITEKKHTGKLAVLDSAHNIQTVYLLVNDKLMETLTAKQQAAVQQASVMACGYCRTLSDRKREAELKKLEELGVQIVQINLEKYYAMMGDVYQDETNRMLYRPDPELDRVIRSDAVKETF